MGAPMASLSCKPLSSAAAEALRTGIRMIDALLRRKTGIYEFNASPHCIFRVSEHHLPSPLYPPGTVPGRDRVLELHFRMDRIPPIPPSGVDMAYAKRLALFGGKSFRMLAAHVQHDPRMADIAGIGALTPCLFAGNLRSGERLAARIGLAMRPQLTANGAVRRFFNDLYAVMLMWAYNPQTLRERNLMQLEWYCLWMDREALLARFAAPPGRDKPRDPQRPPPARTRAGGTQG